MLVRPAKRELRTATRDPRPANRDRVKIVSAEFVISSTAAGRADGIPRDGITQVALAGRSNVGKSTLINALGRSRIARTSAAPGKTRLANVYRFAVDGGAGGPGRWTVYLVDLPGYGYARGGPGAARELAAVAEGYLARGPGRGERGTPTLLLVDARHPGLQADVDALAWLRSLGVEPHVVATKVDKLTRAERARNLKTAQAALGTAVMDVSAATGEGLDELWRLIAQLARRT